MASKLPYMASPGLLPKILEKMEQARRPERFTQDFLETKLGHSGGSARAIIPLLKRMGFIGSDGVPTELYDRFRNSETQGAAVAEGMKRAYSELFERNEYANDLSKEKLTGQVIEVTGASKDDSTTRFTVSTFLALNDLADFEADVGSSETDQTSDPEPSDNAPAKSTMASHQTADPTENVELRVGYTINLNLPESTDPAVFDAIFSSLSKHLLKR